MFPTHKQFLEIYNPTYADDVYDGLKEMLGGTIESHVEDIYRFSISVSQVSVITDKIIPQINEWQTSPLEAVYSIMAYTMDGTKDILGMWIGENEFSRFWLSVLNELKTVVSRIF